MEDDQLSFELSKGIGQVTIEVIAYLYHLRHTFIYIHAANLCDCLGFPLRELVGRRSLKMTRRYFMGYLAAKRKNWTAADLSLFCH